MSTNTTPEAVAALVKDLKQWICDDYCQRAVATISALAKERDHFETKTFEVIGTNDDLRARLYNSENISRMMAQAADNLKAHADSLQQQLTAAQAREARLREACERVASWPCDCTWPESYRDAVRDELRAALAQSQEVGP